MLHEKLDHLMIHQHKRLLEMQEIQADFLEVIMKGVNKLKGNHNEDGKGPN